MTGVSELPHWVQRKRATGDRHGLQWPKDQPIPGADGLAPDRTVGRSSAPAQLIEGGIPTEALVAQLAVARLPYQSTRVVAPKATVLAGSL
jgi:hypothetical protein